MKLKNIPTHLKFNVKFGLVQKKSLKFFDSILKMMKIKISHEYEEKFKGVN